MRKELKQKTAVIYTRFSPRRDPEKCYSLETQFELCTYYCKGQEIEIIGNYEDEAISGGSTDNRPGLRDAIDHAKREKAVLVCYAWDRLARSTKDALLLLEELEGAGAGLASTKENCDTTTPSGKMLYTVLSAFNEMERKKISIRTSDAMREHMRNGMIMCDPKRLPYGMKLDPDRSGYMIEDDTEQEIIREMFYYNTAGIDENTGEEVEAASLRETAAMLDESGRKPRAVTVYDDDGTARTVFKLWDHCAVNRIMKRAERLGFVPDPPANV